MDSYVSAFVKRFCWEPGTTDTDPLVRSRQPRTSGGRRCWAGCHLTSLLDRLAQHLRERLRLPYSMHLLGNDREPDRLQPDLVIVDNKGVYPMRDGRHVGNAGPGEEDEITVHHVSRG